MQFDQPKHETVPAHREFNFDDFDAEGIASEALSSIEHNPHYRDLVEILREDPKGFGQAFRNGLLERLNGLAKEMAEIRGAAVGKSGPRLSMRDVLTLISSVSHDLGVDVSSPENETESAPLAPEADDSKIVDLPPVDLSPLDLPPAADFTLAPLGASHDGLFEPASEPAPEVVWRDGGRALVTPPPRTVSRKPGVSGFTFTPPQPAERHEMTPGQELYADSVRDAAKLLVSSRVPASPALKALRIIWDHFPDYRDEVVANVSDALAGLFDGKTPEAVGLAKLQAEAKSSLLIAADELYMTHKETILARLRHAEGSK